MKSFRFNISTKLEKCDKDHVWEHMTNMDGVNSELSPWMKMSFPKGRSSLVGLVHEVPMRTTLFGSVLLLFGIIPIDLHWLSFDRLDEGHGFDENSSSLLQKYWKHSRHIITFDSHEDIIVRDDVEFLPRISIFGYLVLPIVKFLFAHRHRQLKKKFHQTSTSIRHH